MCMILIAVNARGRGRTNDSQKSLCLLSSIQGGFPCLSHRVWNLAALDALVVFKLSLVLWAPVGAISEGDQSFPAGAASIELALFMPRRGNSNFENYYGL